MNFPSTFAQSSNGEIFALTFCNKEYSQSELFFYMIHLPQYISFRIIFLAFFFSFYRVSLVERCIRSLKVMKPSSHFFNIQPLPIPSFPSTVRTLLVSQFILISGIVFPLLDAIQVIGLHKPFETCRDCLQRKVKLLVF